MEMLTTVLVPLMKQVFYFLLLILVIVSVHEFGHYLMARVFKVKVQRFSIGLGRKLWEIKKGGTEWRISLWPIGGYVRMLDGREDPLKPGEEVYAFDHQKPWKKILIYAAGPVMNFVLSFILFIGIFYFEGIPLIKPEVHAVFNQSLAQKAGFKEGDTIVKINGHKIEDFAGALSLTLENLERIPLHFSVVDKEGRLQERTIDARKYQKSIKNILLGKESFGLSPDRALLEIEKVVPDSPASKAGLQSNDRLIALDGKKLRQHQDLMDVLTASKGKAALLQYERKGKRYETWLKAEKNSKTDKFQIGIRNKIDESLAKSTRSLYHPKLVESIRISFNKTVHFAWATFRFLGGMVVGENSLLNLNGPVTMAGYAGEAASLGGSTYLAFLAIVSISIGVLNLLPIPMLDGGGACMALIEWMRKKPLRIEVQEKVAQLGFVLMVCLMVVALYNDFIRIFG